MLQSRSPAAQGTGLRRIGRLKAPNESHAAALDIRAIKSSTQKKVASAAASSLAQKSSGMQAMHQMTMMRAPDSLFGKGPVPDGHWAECAAEMQLAPEQVQHLFTIREAFCKRAAALRDQRRALIRASTQVLLLILSMSMRTASVA